MRIFLYRGACTRELHQDVELLNLRGYDVMCVCDLLHIYPDAGPQELHHAMARNIMGTRHMPHRVVVFHPNSDPASVLDLVGFCRTVDIACVRLSDLPALAPESEAALREHDLRVGRFLRITKELSQAPTLGDRLRAVYHSLRHWEARVNAVLGDSLKNTAARSVQPSPKPYKPNTSASTTG